MAKALPGKIDVEITTDTIEFLNSVAARIEKLAKALTPIASENTAYLGETPEQQHQRLKAGQSTPTRMREVSKMYRKVVEGLEARNKTLRGVIRGLREDLENARQRAQYDVTRWRDAEAEIKRLRARIGDDGNVLEANAQLRAENAELVNRIAELERRVDELTAENTRLRIDLTGRPF
jgi:chromosome segregation ATPase